MSSKHGGARPNSGGKRQGAGRPRGSCSPDPHSRTVSISLSESSDGTLARLKDRLGVNASEVVRRALAAYELDELETE